MSNSGGNRETGEDELFSGTWAFEAVMVFWREALVNSYGHGSSDCHLLSAPRRVATQSPVTSQQSGARVWGDWGEGGSENSGYLLLMLPIPRVRAPARVVDTIRSIETFEV